MAAKRVQGENVEHYYHRLLMARSGAIVRHQNEQAAKSGTVDRLDLEEVRKLMRMAIGLPCPYCREKITPKIMSLDHIVPLARQGEHVIANCQVICEVCNSRKGPLSDGEYRGLLALIEDWTPASRQDVLRRLRAGAKALMSMFWKYGKKGGEGPGKPAPPKVSKPQPLSPPATVKHQLSLL